MQRMQRITGRFLPRTPNEADVEAMLKDFSDSEVMLEKVRLLWLVVSECCLCEQAGSFSNAQCCLLILLLSGIKVLGRPLHD